MDGVKLENWWSAAQDIILVVVGNILTFFFVNFIDQRRYRCLLCLTSKLFNGQLGWFEFWFFRNNFDMSTPFFNLISNEKRVCCLLLKCKRIGIKVKNVYFARNKLLYLLARSLSYTSSIIWLFDLSVWGRCNFFLVYGRLHTDTGLWCLIDAIVSWIQLGNIFNHFCCMFEVAMDHDIGGRKVLRFVESHSELRINRFLWNQ